MRVLTIAAMVLGLLAIPSTALATHGGSGHSCAYATSQDHDFGLGPLVVYADNGGGGGSSGTADTSLGACADFNNTVNVGPVRFDGGTVEKGVGEDPGNGAGDPGGDRPDGYLVVDGDDDSVDPMGQSDGYVGVSNWETSNGRVSETQCEASPPSGGPNNGTPGSSNSGGCVGPAPAGPWVYVPEDAPTPICGNTSGNAWDGSGSHGNHNRDGCQFP